jgi:hypothetical protein
MYKRRFIELPGQGVLGAEEIVRLVSSTSGRAAACWKRTHITGWLDTEIFLLSVQIQSRNLKQLLASS